MRVALITPFYLQSTRGNAVTVRRILQYLLKAGCCAEVFSLDILTPDLLKNGIKRFSPDIIHAFHGIRCGGIAFDLATETGRPYIITITGTELGNGAKTSFSARERLSMEQAAAVVVFQELIASSIAAALPEVSNRLHVIPQGVEMPGISSDSILPDFPFFFLLPAGIRPVKNILFAVSALRQLWIKYPQTRLLLAGPVLDESYFAEVSAALASAPFAEWIGEVPNAEMPELYRSVHVVLNTSFSEGGMANALLEGMAHGKVVLASDIEGNRSLVQDSINGFLYHNEKDFLEKAERVINDSALRKRIGADSRDYVETRFSPFSEAHKYLALYKECC